MAAYVVSFSRLCTSRSWHELGAPHLIFSALGLLPVWRMNTTNTTTTTTYYGGDEVVICSGNKS